MTGRTMHAQTCDAVVDADRGALTRRGFLMLAGTVALAALGGCSAAEAGSGTVADGSGTAADGSAGAATPDAEAASVAQTDADGSARAADEPVKGATFAFNTLVSITAYGVGEDDVTACLEDCARYEDLFSARKEGTDIARVNAAGGEPVEVDPATAEVLGRALEYGEESEGRFDVTIGAVSLLWDFVEGVKPADEDIREALRHVDYTKLHVDGTTVTLDDPDARLDLGGIAKGWIGEALVERLVAAGASAALVSLGSSTTYALGCKPGGSPWRIGLRDPKAESVSTIFATIEVQDRCVTSSGLYDQEFEVDGTWYWHILDPATGYPAETDMLGVTIVNDDPTQGDALSTTLFIMGIDAATAWVEERHPEITAMFVGTDDDPTFANGFVEDCGYALYESGGQA